MLAETIVVFCGQECWGPECGNAGQDNGVPQRPRVLGSFIHIYTLEEVLGKANPLDFRSSALTLRVAVVSGFWIRHM